jgi:serine protease Do
VVVLRDGKEQTVKVTLGRLEDSDQAAAAECGGWFAGRRRETRIPARTRTWTSRTAIRLSRTGRPEPASRRPMRPAKNVLGFATRLSAETRKTFGIAEERRRRRGAEVSPDRPRPKRDLKAGDVIVEVAQEFMKLAGGRRGQGAIAEAGRPAQRAADDRLKTGDLRFVAVPME